MPRVIETNLTEEDKKIEKTLRPQCLDDYIGQEKAKSTLKFISKRQSNAMIRWITFCFTDLPVLERRRLRGLSPTKWAST